jgi:hypothetical protein
MTSRCISIAIGPHVVYWCDRKKEDVMRALLTAATMLASVTVAGAVTIIDDTRADETLLVYATEYLKDPVSAQFRKLRETDMAVCGEINARNEFGGYTGFVWFYVTKGIPFTGTGYDGFGYDMYVDACGA